MTLKKTLLILVAVASSFVMSSCSSSGCSERLASTESYASLESGILKIGNGHIERTWEFRNGDLRTVAFTNKDTGERFQNTLKGADFRIQNIDVKAENGLFEVVRVDSDGIRPAHLEASVSYTKGRLEIRRVFRVYDDCAAIACDNFVKGIPAGIDLPSGKNAPRLDAFSLDGKHWQCRAVEFIDRTDDNNNLVMEHKFVPYKTKDYRGNLLLMRNGIDDRGFYILKESPCLDFQLAYPGADFRCGFGAVSVCGIGAELEDFSETEWIKLYSTVLGVYGKGELSALTSLRTYQKSIREHFSDRDEMVMMNTWGDRSQDAKVNEKFCLAELDKASRLGITHFQIDDGWQEGKSPNSAQPGGSFNNIWHNPRYWTPAVDKYPEGLGNVVAKAEKLGIELGLWFNPSYQNDFEDWEKDVEAVVKLHGQYGIKVFKIDGVKIPSKKAETNLRRFFDTVLERTGNKVIFNLDVTSGRRGGYHMFNEYGNLFLENRYSDWQNYYPYWTLRNLWQLSKYVPAERLQVEFLNNWRNADKYGDDPFSPQKLPFEYLFAITMAGQPLAWMEASNLPEEAFSIAPIVEKYKSIMADFHSGTILPIGEEPSGRSWTGFQSISKCGKCGYVIVYRELNDRGKAKLQTWFPAGSKIRFKCLIGKGKDFSARTDEFGKVLFGLPEQSSYAVYSYRY